jgi:hypothetical protein
MMTPNVRASTVRRARSSSENGIAADSIATTKPTNSTAGTAS